MPYIKGLAATKPVGGMSWAGMSGNSFATEEIGRQV